MNKELSNLNKGEKVWCDGDSGFCHASVEIIEDVVYKFDEDNGEKYKVIILGGNRRFDSRNGRALTPPLAYYIKSQ